MAASGMELESPVKQCITVLEKKIRNLEKRKGKLDAYKQSKKTVELDKDQKDALAKYDVVLQNIEFAKELQKQFLEINTDTEKAQKKLAKREKVERHQQEIQRLQELLKLNSLLNALGNDSVREDFRSGKHTSVVLTEDHLVQLDDCYQIFFPTREVDQTEECFAEQLSAAAEHVVGYLDHQDKKVINTTYKELHELIERISSCGYFDRNQRVEVNASQLVNDSVPEVEQYEEQSAVELENAMVDERPESVNQTNNICRTGGGGSDGLGDIACPVGHISGQPDPYRSTHWSHSPVLVTQQPAVMAPTSGVIAMTTGQVDGPQPGGFLDGAYYSSYAKQRPLQEIVSSLQGSYNFLQESQIDLEGHTQSQSGAEIVYNSFDNQNSGQPIQSYKTPQQPTLGPQSAIDPTAAALHASQPHFDHDLSQPGQMYHPQGAASAGAYGVQGLHNVYGHHQMAHEPGFDPNYGQMEKTQYNFMEQQTYVLSQMNPSGDPSSHVAGMNVSSTAGPQPIPLPSQAIHGQSLTEQGFGGTQQTAAEMSDAMSKKQFTMNPNADIFRSVYNEPAAPSGDQIKQDIPPQPNAGDGQAMRTFAQTASANFQASGVNRGFGGGSSFGSGGPPRGSGPSRGSRGGGRDSTLNNGVQSGGRGGGPSNANRGNMPSMASNGQRGGARGGLSRGGNSNVRGGGGSRGFGRNGQQSGHEQATHA